MIYAPRIPKPEPAASNVDIYLFLEIMQVHILRTVVVGRAVIIRDGHSLL